MKYTYMMDEFSNYIILENGEPMNPQVVGTRLEQLEAALTLIRDVAYGRDGYTGDAEKLGKLVDEIYKYARNPQSALDLAEHRR